MKKLLTAMLLVTMLTLGLTCVLAEERPTVYTSGDYRYILLEDGTAEICAYTGRAMELTVPAELDGYAVTGIGAEAFANDLYLHDITFPEGLVYIGDHAFSAVNGLTTITIPDSVTVVGANPFRWCGGLKEIVVSADHPALEVIDGALFDKREHRIICCLFALRSTSVTIPQGTLMIGASSFDGCMWMTAVDIPDSVTFIGDRAFTSCIRLTALSIPDSVTSIGESVFEACLDLETIMVSAGSYAAQYCEANGIPYTCLDAAD